MIQPPRATWGVPKYLSSAILKYLSCWSCRTHVLFSSPCAFLLASQKISITYDLILETYSWVFVLILISELVSHCGYTQCLSQAGLTLLSCDRLRPKFGQGLWSKTQEGLSGKRLLCFSPYLKGASSSDSSVKQYFQTSPHPLLVEVLHAPRASNNPLIALQQRIGTYWCSLHLRAISKHMLWANIPLLRDPCGPLKESSKAFNPSQAKPQVRVEKLFIAAWNKEKK